MIDPASVEFQRSLEEQLDIILQAVSNNGLQIISERLEAIKLGNYSYSDVYKNYLRDLKGFEATLESARETVNYLLSQQYKKASLANDEWAKKYYEEMGVTQLSTNDSETLQRLLKDSVETAQKVVRDNLNTSVVGIVDNNGKFKKWGTYYKEVISKGVTGMLSGSETYQQAIDGAVSELAKSGLRVSYGKTTRELFSAVRMNVMDNYRQMIQQMRNVQGEEYGADGWEITAHALCAPDHLPYQGEVFTDKEYQDIQSALSRPLVEGANCHHIAYRVKYDIAIKYKAIDREDLDEMNRLSTEEVELTGLSGDTLKMTRYEATQYQRKLETELRKLKTEKVLSGDSSLNKRIKAVNDTYKNISKQAGLSTKSRNTKAYFASV